MDIGDGGPSTTQRCKAPRTTYQAQCLVLRPSPTALIEHLSRQADDLFTIATCEGNFGTCLSKSESAQPPVPGGATLDRVRKLGRDLLGVSDFAETRQIQQEVDTR